MYLEITRLRITFLNAIVLPTLALLFGCAGTHTADLARLQSSTAPLTVVPSFDLLSKGDGLPHRGQWRSQMAITDINGDGMQDLVLPAARKGGSRPQMFLGQFDGSWAEWKDASLPNRRYDYGGVAVLNTGVDGDEQRHVVYGMHLKGLAAITQTSPGKFNDASAGLNNYVDGSPSVAGSQALLALPRPAAIGGSQLFVAYEAVQNGGVGASVWIFSKSGWQRHDVPGAPSGSHPGIGARDKVFYLGRGGVTEVDASREKPSARLAGSLPQGTFAHALAVLPNPKGNATNAYIATSRYIDDSWSRRVERFSNLAGTGDAPIVPDTVIAERQGSNYFSALAVTQARPWGLPGEILAVGDDHGIIDLYHVDATGRSLKLGQWPAAEWRRGCTVSQLEWAKLNPGEPPQLAAMFSGEPSVYDIGRGCLEGGGLDVFALTTLAPTTKNISQ
ncbi:MAG: hypothetical protein V4805_16335 [Pseudomonadota bacterium]